MLATCFECFADWVSSDVAGDERRLRGVDALWGKAGRRGKLQVAAAKLQTSANCEIETLSLACHMLIKTEKPTGLHTHTQSHIQGTHTHTEAHSYTQSHSLTHSHTLCVDRNCGILCLSTAFALLTPSSIYVTNLNSLCLCLRPPPPFPALPTTPLPSPLSLRCAGVR